MMPFCGCALAIRGSHHFQISRVAFGSSMEQLSPTEPCSVAASPIVTLGDIANVNAIEVHANGIYRSSNQLEAVRAVSRTPSTRSDVEKAPAEVEVELAGAAAMDEVALEKGAVQSPDDADEPEPRSQQQEVPPAEDLAAANSGIEASEPHLHQDAADALVSPPDEVAAAAASTDPSERRKCASINGTFVAEDTLTQVQQFLIIKINDNQCSSHSQEIHEFVTQTLAEKQLARYFPPLVQRITDHFHLDAQAKHEDVSLDVQSSLCLLEQMFLTIGRATPFQDIYTAEEEEMLDQLAEQSARRSEEQAC